MPPPLGLRGARQSQYAAEHEQRTWRLRPVPFAREAARKHLPGPNSSRTLDYRVWLGVVALASCSALLDRLPDLRWRGRFPVGLGCGSTPGLDQRSLVCEERSTRAADAGLRDHRLLLVGAHPWGISITEREQDLRSSPQRIATSLDPPAHLVPARRLRPVRSGVRTVHLPEPRLDYDPTRAAVARPFGRTPSGRRRLGEAASGDALWRDTDVIEFFAGVPGFQRLDA
jgi:hypothetical protein